MLYRDFFSVQLSPYKIEFGHVCEDPHNWEQRYEKKDFKNHRDMGKVTTIIYLALLSNLSFFLFRFACMAEGIGISQRQRTSIKVTGRAANATSLRDMRGPDLQTDCSLLKYASCALYVWNHDSLPIKLIQIIRVHPMIFDDSFRAYWVYC